MSGMRQFLLLAAVMFGLMLAAPSVYAQTDPAPTGDDTKLMETECGKHVGLTNRIAGCVRESIGNIADKFFGEDTDGDGAPDSGFYPLVSKFVAGVLTLGMAIYGVMAAAGMLEKVGRDTLFFLVKVSFIAYFSLNADVMYDYAIRGMDAAGEAVVQVAPKYGTADGTKDFSDITCLKVMNEAAYEAGKPPVGPWVAMDCMLDTVFGIKIDTHVGGGGPTGGGGTKWFNDQIGGKGLTRGLVFFFFSGMQTSVVGLMLAILGFIFMWGLITMIIKALMTYIAGYIGITFLMIISPIFIPLLLFRTTKEYFDKWVKLVISFALQPVLILLFVSLSIAAVDLALYSGDYSVMYRIAGKESRKAGFNLNTYLTDNDAITSKPMTALFVKTNDTITKTKSDDAPSVVSGITTGPCERSMMVTGGTGDPSCKDNMPIQAYRDTIDWEKLAEAREKNGVPVTLSDGAERKEQQISREVLAAVIFCGIVIFVMNRMMSVVPHILVDLVGDFGQTPNLFRGATGGWNDGAQALSGQASGMVQSALSNLASGRSRGAGG